MAKRYEGDVNFYSIKTERLDLFTHPLLIKYFPTYLNPLCAPRTLELIKIIKCFRLTSYKKRKLLTITKLKLKILDLFTLKYDNRIDANIKWSQR